MLSRFTYALAPDVMNIGVSQRGSEHKCGAVQIEQQRVLAQQVLLQRQASNGATMSLGPHRHPVSSPQVRFIA